MKNFLNFIYSRKLILILSLLVNIVVFVLFASFVNIYLYIALSGICVLLFIFLGQDSLSTENYKFTLTLLFFILPIVAYMLYTFTKAKKSTRKFRSKWRQINHENAELFDANAKILDDLAKASPKSVKFCKYLQTTTNMPIAGKSSSEYFSNGIDYLNEIYKEIKNAKSSILLELSSIKEGEAWKELFEILKQKAMEGVKITLLYDEKQCLNSFKDKKAFRKLENHGINAIKFNKIKLISSSLIYSRNKKNLVIVDSEVAFMSTTAFRDEYINVELPNAKSSDGIKIMGEAVWSLIVLFVTDVRLFTNEKIELETFKNNLTSKAKSKSYIQSYGVAPFFKDKLIKNNLLNAIYTAEKSLTIISPYFAIDGEVRNALKIASKNGIEIKIIISDKNEKLWQKAISIANLDELVKERVKIYQYESNILCKSAILIDETIALVGGGVLDLRNMYSHFDIGSLIINDSELNSKIKQTSEILITNSHLVTMKDLTQTNLMLKMYGKALKLVWALL